MKDGRWVVDINVPTEPGEPVRGIGQVYVDPSTGLVTESWTGFQVAWTMARGYPGAFGHSVNSPWIWVTLCVLFLLPFVDVRRPLRWLHLDLLALLGFSASLAFFNNANLGLSVPLTYPLLAYLLARLLWIGLRRYPASAAAAAPQRPVEVARGRDAVPARLPRSASTRPTATSSTSATRA